MIDQGTDPVSLAEAALAYAEADGWPVFPGLAGQPCMCEAQVP